MDMAEDVSLFSQLHIFFYLNGQRFIFLYFKQFSVRNNSRWRQVGGQGGGGGRFGGGGGRGGGYGGY